jgi:hypothetical protein
METFLQRITKLTSTMPDTALPIPAETPRSLTPSQPPENFAVTASSVIAGWAMSSLKKQVLGNGEGRPDSAPPNQTRFVPVEMKGLGTMGDVDAWKDEELEWGSRVRQKSAPEPSVQSLGMKLPVKNKKSLVEKVVEEEERKSVEVDEWPGLEEWGDDDEKDDGWGFDD